jgi:hypothetical protein
MAGGGNDTGSRRGDPYREVVSAEHVRLVFPPPRDFAALAGIGFIFLCVALMATTGAAFVWASTGSFVWRAGSGIGALVYAAWIGR